MVLQYDTEVQAVQWSAGWVELMDQVWRLRAQEKDVLIMRRLTNGRLIILGDRQLFCGEMRGLWKFW